MTADREDRDKPIMMLKPCMSCIDTLTTADFEGEVKKVDGKRYGVVIGDSFNGLSNPIVGDNIILQAEMDNDAEKFTYVNMDSYVVHIYRRDRIHSDKIIGIVETISTGKKDAFKSASALLAILTKPADKM